MNHNMTAEELYQKALEEVPETYHLELRAYAEGRDVGQEFLEYLSSEDVSPCAERYIEAVFKRSAREFEKLAQVIDSDKKEL